MVLNVAARGVARVPPAFRLLLWCGAGAILVQALLAWLARNPFDFSPAFAYLLRAFDGHGNAVLAVLAVAAFLLRRQQAALEAVRLAADHTWTLAAAAFVLYGAGAWFAYRAYPLAMDEYVAWFQAQAFAAGKLGGQFPPDLLDQLLPRLPANYFLVASRATGEVSGAYLPGFALLAAPFACAGVPWLANPAISALTLPALRGLVLELSESREAAGWAILLTLASPVVAVNAFGYYAMPAHLLCSVLYAWLLLRPTIGRALAAGVVGSLALALHNPAPHLLFAAAFVVWLVARRTPVTILLALAAGYAPLTALLWFGWQQHLASLMAAAPPATHAAVPAVATPSASGPGAVERVFAQVGSAISLPTPRTLAARLAGLAKAWTWASAGLFVLAAWGFAVARALPAVRVLAAALAVTFFGYFLVPFDQGHGWGYRYLHSAWFVLPVLAGLGLARADDELRAMAIWAVLLSLVVANGLRASQAELFVRQHLAQVPPLAAMPMGAGDPARPEIVFVDPTAGAYTRDMVHNDPFLRGDRKVMVYDGHAATQALMARRFPGYTLASDGRWGALWTKEGGRK